MTPPDYRKRAESIIVHKSDCDNLNDGDIDIGLCICNYELRVDNLIQDFKEVAQENRRATIEECAEIAENHAEQMWSLISDNRLNMNEVSGRSAQSVLIAKAIRALGEKE